MLVPSQPQTTIRPLQADDISAMATLYCEAFNASPWSDQWSDQSTHDTAARRLTEALETPGSLGLLLYQGDRLVGGLIGYQEQWYDGSHFFLKEIFVAQESQRRGIGTQLARHLKQTLIDQGVSRIYLLTERESAAAEFYAKQGFYVSPRMNMMAYRLETD